MIAAILLAAGNARRFDGSQKLVAMVPYERQRVPLARASASGLLKAGLEQVVVVIGRDADRVRAALEGLPVAFVVNADYASGMSSSLRTGVAEACRLWPDSDGLLVALADQPLGASDSEIIEQLLATFRARGPLRAQSIVAPRFRGAPGNPVIFGNGLVAELFGVSGDRGARSVVEGDATRVYYVDFDREAPTDVDTIEDLAKYVADGGPQEADPSLRSG